MKWLIESGKMMYGGKGGRGAVLLFFFQNLKGNLIASEVSRAANSKLAANVCKILFENKHPKRNDLFARGRMAYVVELEDEEADVPSTLLRSVLDCPIDQSAENINADNLLINVSC